MKKSHFELLTGFVMGFVLCGLALWFFRGSKARKTFLLWAQETVEFGSRELGKDRAIYRLVFRDFSADGADKGFIVLVSVKEGEVWDFYRIPARKSEERQTRDKAP